jgi:hypothetical protein
MNSLERQTEQINPISTIVLWQKQAALKSTLSSVGTAINRRRADEGRKVVCKAGYQQSVGYHSSVSRPLDTVAMLHAVEHLYRSRR